MFTAANKGSYIAQAGQANPVLNAFQVANAYSFDAFDLAQSGMKADAAKYISKVENEAKKNYYKSVGKADIQGQKELDKVRDKAQGQQRMAGMLAGLGAMSYELTRPKIKPPKPAERKSADMSAVESAVTDRLESLQSQINSFKDGLTDPDKKPTSSSGTVTDTSTLISTGISPTSGTSLNTKSTSWSPLSSTIALAEGTLGKDGKIQYGTFYGGGKFTNFDKHPDVVNHTDFGSSAAAGGYQFMPATYKGVAKELGLTDFTPTSQEAAARQLTKWRGVDPDAEITTVSQFANTLHKLSPEWAGLPNLDGVSHYKGLNGNRAMNFERLRKHFEKVSGRTLLDD